jgi:hypothetical protein
MRGIISGAMLMALEAAGLRYDEERLDAAKRIGVVTGTLHTEPAHLSCTNLQRPRRVRGRLRPWYFFTWASDPACCVWGVQGRI